MAAITFQPIRSNFAPRLLGVVLSGMLLMAVSGCAMLESCTFSDPPAVPVNHVLTYWDSSLRFVSDTVHPGTQMPGLAGRVYLLNDDLKDAVDAQGTISAALYDRTPGGDAQKPIAGWVFHPLDLKRLKRKDRVGDGYTLFLPWETYRPEIKNVRLLVAYTPKNGEPHYAEPTDITLRSENPFTIERRTEIATGASPAPKQ